LNEIKDSMKELDKEIYRIIDNASDKERARRALEYYLYDKGSVLSLLEFGITESIRQDDMTIFEKFEKAFEYECYVKYSDCFGFLTFCAFSGLIVQFFKKEKSAVKGEKHLYVIQMSNGSVKIGIASDIERRYSQIKSSCGMKIVKHWESNLLADAHLIEQQLHKHFKKHRLNGEYFNVDYDEAVIQANEMIGG